MDQQDTPQDMPQDAPEPTPTPEPPSYVPEPAPAPTPTPEPTPTALPYSTLATVSLIAGILGFTFMPVLASIVALVTGYSARKETRAVPPLASGDGMATAGIVMGWIQIGLTVVLCCCMIAGLALLLPLGNTFRR